ncbi:unnamed protein product [Sphenostylis stenocarpa]|uniref:Nucleoside diphosphate kinase n=1 Tax=Sphenostylis stenocarpa TaxID=92480 RepID=A0AA86VKR4_9FABA|nr:unnamed protein product [Sphenostylis stenocarpa]
MEAVCGTAGVCVTSSLPRSPTLFKTTIPLSRVSYQHLTPFPSQSHLFSYHTPPYARTLRARTTVKPAIFLPHLIASLQQVDQTYIMVKPDGVQRGLVGEIISRFEKKGFKLTGLKLFQCSKELAEGAGACQKENLHRRAHNGRGAKLYFARVNLEKDSNVDSIEHYKDLKQKSFFPKLIDYITSGPVVCMAWEGVGVVASARKLIGATDPLQAEPGTIRGDLAVQTGRNVVHGSDSPENGKREIALWFKEGELCEWTPVQAPWLRE